MSRCWKAGCWNDNPQDDHKEDYKRGLEKALALITFLDERSRSNISHNIAINCVKEEISRLEKEEK